MAVTWLVILIAAVLVGGLSLAAASPGTRAVLLMVVLGVVLGAFAVWFRVPVQRSAAPPVMATDPPAADFQPPDPTGDEAEAVPAWVKSPPLPAVVKGTYRTVLATELGSVEECRRELLVKLEQAVRDYAQSEFGSAELVIDGDLLQRIVQEEHVQHVPREVAGETVRLYRVWALVAFDDAVRGELRHRWRAAEVRQRLRYTAGLLVLLLTGLTSVFGYLKLDTMTRGYYSARLKLAAAAVLLAGTAVAAWLAGLLEAGGSPAAY